MPISGTGISTKRLSIRPSALRKKRVRSRGFSLLELLIVVTIIGIFAGVAVLSMGVVGSDREVEREAFRLQSLMNLLREEALMQSRDFGVEFAENGYRFYVYDYQQLRWILPLGDNLLAARELVEPVNVDLRVEDRDLVLEMAREDDGMDDEEDPEPQVMILSSGEMTPFEASFFRDLGGGRFTLTAEIDGTLEVTQDGYDAP